MAKKSKVIPIVFSAIDYFGNTVILHQQVWTSHILDPVEGHPQMLGYEHLIQQVLADPFEIREGAWPTAAVFISDPLVGPRPEGIRTVVEYNTLSFIGGACTGLVRTAYPIDTVTYKTPRIGKLLARRK